MQAVMEFLASLGAKGIKLSLSNGTLDCYAPPGALDEATRASIVQMRSHIIAMLEERARQRPGSALPRRFPLAAGAAGLFVRQQVDPASCAYNVPLCLRSRRGIDAAHVARAWELVQDQFPILQSRIVDEDGRLSHVIDDACRTALSTEQIDIAGEQAMLAFLRERVQRPFDLEQGPLTRAEMFVNAQGGTTLLITIHHIVVDGVSSVILLSRMFMHYLALAAGRSAPAGPVSDGYRQFVDWEQAMLASPEGQAHADYWRTVLDGAPPPAEFAPVSASGGAPGADAMVMEPLTAALSNAVMALSRRCAVQPSAIFLAAFQLLLHRYTGQEDLVVTMPVMGRAGGRFGADVGYFVNMIALRSRYCGATDLQSWLQDAGRGMIDALYHSPYPFPRIANDQKQAGGHADFRISYAFQNVFKLQDIKLPDGGAFDVELVGDISQPLDGDLGLEIYEDKGVYALHLKYAQRVLSARMAIGMLGQLRTLLEAAVGDTSCSLDQLDLVDAGERHLLLETFNDTAVPFPEERCVHEFFQELAAGSPDLRAAAFAGTSLTYGQLHARCADLALHLQGLGVGADSLVGLYMERSLELMVGLMGTLVAGGAYVPLDPDYPADRLGYMLADTNAGIVLTQARLLDRLRTLAAPGTVLIALDSGWAEVAASAQATRAAGGSLRQLARPDSLAYVIYTSGSTGRPKGVMLEHRALMNRIHWMQNKYRLDQCDVVLQKTPYSFDVSVWEFVWPLMAGASVVFAEPGGHMDVLYLRRLIDSAGVTTLHYVPSMLRAFLENADGQCPGVRQIFCSGEALDRRSAGQYRARFPNAALHNLYGPTEAAIDVTYHDCAVLPDAFVPIGAPIDNIALYVTDQNLRLQPLGVAGELQIAGVGLARGYLNLPQLTSERFVANPYRPGERMYRTGDLARWLEDGTIQYLGRIDTQVKIRGFRIELGEIEHQLNQHPLVEDSVVVAAGFAGEQRLVAYYVARGDDHGEAPGQHELRLHLQASLAAHMVPSAFVGIDAIPLTPNGKVDRRRLEQREVSAQTARSHVAPHSASERALAALWEQLLGLEAGQAGADDDFFELGGHSLLATQLRSRVRRELGVDVPLRAMFDHTTLRALAAVVDAMAPAAGAAQAAIARADRSRFATLPLSYAQERLWFLDQLEPGAAGYNCPGAVTLRGAFDGDALERAFNTIIARHETLRTIFPSEDGQACQVILDELRLRLERIDLSATAGRHHTARRLCLQEAATRFDLGTGPLIRGKLIELGPEERILMLNMHHIISDGWSLGVLIAELGALLEGAAQGIPVQLPALPVQYADYSIWQRERFEQQGVLQRQLDYWRGKLDGVPDRLALATDFARPAQTDLAGATHRLHFDPSLTTALKALAERQGATLFMALLGAFKALLYRVSGQADLCIGSPVANRQQAETEGLIGMFVNTLALRSRVDGAASFATLLGQVRQTCLEAYEHQDTPFEKIVQALKIRPDMGRSPLFQAMLILQNTAAAAAAGNGHAEPYPLDAGISKFDLSLEFTEAAHGMACVIEYRTALFKPLTIARLARQLRDLCAAIVAAPDSPLDGLPCPATGERELQELFNDTAVPFPEERCVHEFFQELAAGSPDLRAAAFAGTSLTYGQLHARCADLALHLQGLGVGADSLVGLYMERSLELMVGLMGTLVAGGAYVPLDPDYPADRLGYMLADTSAGIVLTQARLLDRLRTLAAPGTVLIALDSGWAEVAASAQATRAAGGSLRRLARPDSLAYVIYTSGSTGRPKGVMLEHRALMNRIHWMQNKYLLDQCDVVLQKTPYSFDVSVWEFVWPLMAGASVVFAEPGGHMDVLYLRRLIDSAGVTTLHYVPSMLRAFLENADGQCPGVRQIFCSGEALDRRSAGQYRARFPNAALHNLYGPTEAAIDVTYHDCAVLPDAFVPIGAPIDNIALYVTDQNLQPVALGAEGELLIAGVGLARGYLNLPQLTSERFVANPYRPGERMYRTGDLARWLEDGTIQYLGRIDTQVKIRGFRIELGEIEYQLNTHPQIEDSVVVAAGQAGEQRLVAYFVARGQAPQAQALRDHLGATLAVHMVPSLFIEVDQIPLTPNGKVDRRQLEQRDLGVQPTKARVAPREGTERALAAIWETLLGLQPGQVGAADNFFELGGHSLLATQLLSRMRKAFSVEFTLKSLFDRSTLAQMARRVDAAARPALPDAGIVPVERSATAPLPLSFAQERLWFLDQLEPGTAGYNCPGAVTLHGQFDSDVLEQAFNAIIARHETLRTVFPSQDGRARQLILDQLCITLERIDLRERADRRAEAHRLCMQEAATPFDLARGPLLRARVITLADDERILMLNMHHIISDGWSISVLIDELGRCIDAIARGEQVALAPLPIQYADYAVWQRSQSAGPVLDAQLDYWRGKLAGSPSQLELATDYPRPALWNNAGSTHRFTLDAALAGQLKTLAEQQDGTLFMVLLAAFKTLLYRASGQDDLCIGTPIANRRHAETEGLIGMFVNTLALRTQIDPGAPFSALLAAVRQTCLEAYEHQDTPFEKVVDALRPQRSTGASALFQAMLVLQNTAPAAGAEQVSQYRLDSATSKFDLSLECAESAAGLECTAEYSTLLYKPETIARLCRQFSALCRAIVAAPDCAVDRLCYLGPDERTRVLETFNASAVPFERDATIGALFTRQALAAPGRRATVYQDSALTYGQLHAQCADLALHLQTLGVGADSLVGLYAERSHELIIGAMGILIAGGAYVPLDPDYPHERLAYMLQDTGAAIVLTQSHLLARLRSMAPAGTRLIAIDGERAEMAQQARTSGAVLRTLARPDSLAYVIYTSGSTGKPKGVMVEHRGLVNHNQCVRRRYGVGQDDVQIQVASPSFDLFAEEVFAILLSGACLVLEHKDKLLAADELGRAIAAHGVTILNVPTALFHQLAASGVDPATVRTVVVGGEKLEHARAAAFCARHPHIKLINTYGPTEATIICTMTEVTPQLLASHAAVPIGQPLDNTRIYILDAHGAPQPVGVPGELVIAGAGLARGYLNLPQRSAEQFVADPFRPGERMYRTGDLARWLDDGSIEYLGRIDAQVKIRGYRIEPGEIEAQLDGHPAVASSVVVASGEAGAQRLVAYFVPRQPGVGPDALRDYLQALLPAFMVPVAFIALEQIPLTPNGKVDRRALAQRQVQLQSARRYVAPASAAEMRLAALWEALLELAPATAGVDDSFFDLGGHSLLAVQLIARIKDDFGRPLPLAALFQYPTLGAMAAALAGPAAKSEVLVSLQPAGQGTPLFALPGAGGNVLSFAALARGLEQLAREAGQAPQPIYALHDPGLDGGAPARSVEQAAALALQAVRARQPQGPYYLLGHSYGGAVAYETARLLLEQGQQVASLVLLDALAPASLAQIEQADDTLELIGELAALVRRQYPDRELVLDNAALRGADSAGRAVLVGAAMADQGMAVDSEQLARFLALFDTHAASYRAYRPAPPAAVLPVVLARALAGRAVPVPDDYGWGEVLGQPPRVFLAEGDHMSMLGPDHALQLAAQLQACLALPQGGTVVNDDLAA
ncbi:amino acid adenylation domain-containing protein [Massilia sp. PAMC28688]|uniref:non-ribosomal peptide synthetase n=1 Tax=Massilia sp. PAMC28688 TaxID=2861283 RepID=UPI001C634F99|nr:non-ribosomal peptide synthetase [Massilia sp. PAMC28688]QYF93465.1 amino acid adenylation domain-containing protein [Massilia sp. PAMC28688]